jgi:GrpB-like predicted nucleotidyltransferase (UPF0157 family)
MLGLFKNEVFITTWTKEWKYSYNIEKEKIMKLIGDFIVSFHHIGSTAVEGLSAKPIIDMAVEVSKYEDGFLCINKLETIGYKHKIMQELPEQHYFFKEEPKTHKLHMFPKNSIYFHKVIAFRDCLIEDENTRKKYQKLKEELSVKYFNNNNEYTRAKTDLINTVLKEKKS